MKRRKKSDLVIDICLSMLMGLSVTIGLCMLFYVGVILLPVFLILILGYLVLQGVKFYCKKNKRRF